MSQFCSSCLLIVSISVYITLMSCAQLYIGAPMENISNYLIEDLIKPGFPNMKILVASKNKNILVESDNTCTIGTSSCIDHLSDHETDEWFNALSECRDVWCNNTQCGHEGTVGVPPAGADITGNSRLKLENYTNVISDPAASKTRTYALTIRGKTRSWGTRKELINLFINSNVGPVGRTHTYNYILQVEHIDSRRVRLVATMDQDTEVVAVLGTGYSHQITVVSDKIEDKFAVLINGSLATLKNGMIVRYNIFEPTETYDYNIINWKIFDKKLTSLEQAALMNETPQLIPSNSVRACLCPDNYPIFVRIAHKHPDVWFGLKCMSFKGDKVLRVPESSNSPLFITDGIDSTYWISGVDSPQVKFTIDLETKYHVFMAKIKTETLPVKLLIEAQLERSDPIRPMYLFTPARNDTKLARLHQNYNEVDVYGNEIIVHWIKSGSLNASDYRVLRVEISSDVFLARTIYVTFTGVQGLANQHMIRGIDIYGACGCENYETCTVETDRIVQPLSSSRRKRAAGVIDSFIPISQQVRPFTHEDINGFSCNCTKEQSGDLCDGCGQDMWRDIKSNPNECRLCGCGAGSSMMSCDAQGQCDCDKVGIDRPDLADKQCSAFVWKVFPTFGPIAGGTEITLRTGWFNLNKHSIRVGGKLCIANATRSNYTIVVCKTPPVSTPQVVNVTVDGQTTPLASFEYRENPNITYIGRTSLMISGGVAVEIKGSNLDSISTPYMIINIICKLSGKLVATPQASCTVLSSDSMKCNTPNLEPVLKTISCNFRTSDGSTSPARRRRRDTSWTNQAFVFHYGFILDGYDEFGNSSKPWIENQGTLMITDDPSFKIWPAGEDVKTIENPLDELIEIDGENLNSGADDEDYIIKFGIGFCNMTGLTANKIFCQLPSEQPEPGPTYRKEGSKKLNSIIVTVGNQKNIHIGYVKYAESDTAALLTIIIPVCLGIITLTVVIIVIVCLVRKRRRKMKFKKCSDNKLSRYVAGPHGNVMIIDTSYLTSEHMTTLKPWMIEKENLALGSELGQGQFGKVFTGFLLMKSGNRKQVAVKTLKGELLLTDNQAISNFLQEAVLMKGFQHPNVLSLIAVVLSEDHIPMVVLPFMSKGDLKQILKDEHREFTVGDLMHFALQVATGMDYLQKRKFIHRDLAARNCMVNEVFLVKIADFGLSHDIYSQDYYRVQDRSKPLPVKWMAMESLVSGKYTTESDVWSYGVLVWEILTRGATPYPGIANYEIKNHLKIGQRLQKPEYCPDEVYDLMNSCWEYSASNRPKFQTITEMLSVFLSDDDYTRDQTREITDDYYADEADVEDLPVFVNPEARKSVNEEYDIAAPFTAGSDDVFDEKPILNSNKNAHTVFPEPTNYMTDQANDYLQPRSLPRSKIPSRDLSDNDSKSGYLEFNQF